jgi:hypothetical protein
MPGPSSPRPYHYLVPCNSFRTGAPGQPGCRYSLRAVVQKYVDAREARDPRAIEPRFTADASQLVSDGTWLRGRDELVRGMLESSRRNPARRSIAFESIRLLSSEVALVDGRYSRALLAVRPGFVPSSLTARSST